MNQEPRFQVNYSNLNLKLNNKIQTEKNISIKDFKSLNGGGVQFFKQSYVRGRGGLIIKGGQLSSEGGGEVSLFTKQSFVRGRNYSVNITIVRYKV